jgi:hypothetical protein
LNVESVLAKDLYKKLLNIFGWYIAAFSLILDKSSVDILSQLPQRPSILSASTLLLLDEANSFQPLVSHISSNIFNSSLDFTCDFHQNHSATILYCQNFLCLFESIST